MIAFSLVAFGWIAGRTETRAPELTLAIEAPEGRTMITCVRGCVLQGGRDEGNPDNRPVPKYWFECRGSDLQRCSATVNGWLTTPKAN
jgi:hypothetical protein